MNARVKGIGKVENGRTGAGIRLEPEFVPGLRALDGFGHVVVIWWAAGCDNAAERGALQVERPYRGAPEVMGVFATRSPARPNPVALTTVEVLGIDHDRGVIRVAFIDAEDGTPVLDVKPYTPSFDRVENPKVPAWCAGWPGSTEEAGRFDWSRVFGEEP